MVPLLVCIPVPSPDRVMLMHIGFKQIKRTLQATLKPEIYDVIMGNSDAEHAFGMVLNELPSMQLFVESVLVHIC